MGSGHSKDRVRIDDKGMVRGGHALGILVGITALVLLMAGGAGAV